MQEKCLCFAGAEAMLVCDSRPIYCCALASLPPVCGKFAARCTLAFAWEARCTGAPLWAVLPFAVCNRFGTAVRSVAGSWYAAGINK